MIQGFKNVCRVGVRAHCQVQSKYSSKSNTSDASIKNEWRKRRNIIFDNEVQRLKDEVGRIQKIAVQFIPRDPQANKIELCMNKDLSTPFECARHLSEAVFKTSALALVDGAPWDMHRPFTNDCTLKFLTMQMPEESSALNPAFWRTCSFILGSMIESAFKDEIQMYLHSFPWPNIKAGSFVYDVVLDLPDWKPTDAELRAMSAQFVKITNAELPVERLQVTEKLALDMFQDNPYKSKQIPDMARAQNGMLTLYRIGEHIDISKGPMVANTNIVGKATVAAVHKIESEESDRMYRFQGIALPRGVFLNHVAYSILENRARQLNQTMWMPHKVHEELEEKSQIAANN